MELPITFKNKKKGDFRRERGSIADAMKSCFLRYVLLDVRKCDLCMGVNKLLLSLHH